MSTSSHCAAAAATCSAFVISSRSGCTIRSGATPSILRAPAYTFAQPAASSARTSALPKPRLAPVTRAVDPPIIIAVQFALWPGLPASSAHVAPGIELLVRDLVDGGL